MLCCEQGHCDLLKLLLADQRTNVNAEDKVSNDNHLVLNGLNVYV